MSKSVTRPKVFTHEGKYRRYIYKNEEELENEVLEHFKEIFGDKVIVCARKTKIQTILGISTVPDCFALDLRDPNSPRLLLVEFERRLHDPYEHISSQIVRFRSVLKRKKERILDALEKQMSDDRQFRNLYYAVYKNEPNILIIIDKISEQVKNVCKDQNVDVIEFRTYIKEPSKGLSQNHIHEVLPSFEEEPSLVQVIPEEYSWEYFIINNYSKPEVVSIAKEIEKISDKIYGKRKMPILKRFNKYNLLIFQGEALLEAGLHFIAINPLKTKINLFFDLSDENKEIFNRRKKLVREIRASGFETKDMGEGWYTLSLPILQWKDSELKSRSIIEDLVRSTIPECYAKEYEKHEYCNEEKCINYEDCRKAVHQSD